jgi:hypothetical protein
VIYLDPFRATGRLHAAATLLHEITHLERYRARGFHANRAASVLPKQDFILLGLVDEFAACEAEANLLRSFLAAQPTDEVRRAVRDAIRNPELRWPLALTVMSGVEGPADHGQRIVEARRHVVLDVARNAAGYWDRRHRDELGSHLRERIRSWYQHSREWKDIRAERSRWRDAENTARAITAAAP